MGFGRKTNSRTLGEPTPVRLGCTLRSDPLPSASPALHLQKRLHLCHIGIGGF